MARVLIIGAGGVGRVVARKCLRLPEVFSGVCLAGRSLEKAREIGRETGLVLQTARVDADRPEEVAALIRRRQAEVVLNTALPYQNLAIMEACLQVGAHYLDSAVPEIPGEIWHQTDDRYWYGPQWKYHHAFQQAGITGLLGIGSDPGMVNVFCAYARKHLLDRVCTIDLLDVNGGSHGRPFATNFNPEINLRELQAPVHYWAGGKWQQAPPFSLRWDFLFPQLGRRPMYAVDHDELHSLYRHFPEASQIRFWMGFSPEFLDFFEKLLALGLLSPDPVEAEAADGSTARVAPLKLLKSLLPDPASLAEEYTGRMCIGSYLKGEKDGRQRTVFLYNLCDHQAAFRDAGAQAVSYTAAVPMAAAAVLLARGEWRRPGVHNVEQLDPDPFMELLPRLGMAWHLKKEEKVVAMEEARCRNSAVSRSSR